MSSGNKETGTWFSTEDSGYRETKSVYKLGEGRKLHGLNDLRHCPSIKTEYISVWSYSRILCNHHSGDAKSDTRSLVNV